MTLDEKTIGLAGLGASGLGWLTKQFCQSNMGYDILTGMGLEPGEIIYGMGVSEIVAFGGLLAALYGGTKWLTKKVYNKPNQETISNLTGAWTATYALNQLTHNPELLNKFRETLYSVDSYSPALEDLARTTSQAGVYILPVFITLGIMTGLFAKKEDK